MRCPRCRREIADPAPAFCTRCGAPLRLAEEAAPRPLATSISMDRRAGREGDADAGAGRAEPFGASEGARLPVEGPESGVAALDRSHWDLGPVPPAEAEAPPPDRADAGAGPPEERTGADGEVEVEPLEIHLRRAEPWRRAAAGALDAAPFVAGGIALERWLVRAASAGLPAPTTGLDGLLDLVARERIVVLSVAAVVVLALGVYATLAHALAGATLGKRLFGLRVVGPDGSRPSLSRSAVRSALTLLSAALLGLGVLLALFTRSGRALHDLLARTWVVRAP